MPGSLDTEEIDARQLRPGDVVLVRAGQMIPVDGEIVSGCASIDQSAITGESSPVLREASDQADSLAGTWVLAGQIVLRVSQQRC
jgi:K+-transporting ATPase ATPase B chain